MALSNHVIESMGKNKRSCAVVIDPSLRSILYHAAIASSTSPSSSASSTSGAAVGAATTGSPPSSLSVFMPAGATKEYTLSSTEELDWRDDGPVIFVLRPNPSACKKVAFQMRALIRARARPDFKAIFIPRRSFRCEEILKEEGVISWFTQGLHGVSLGFVSLEEDVISLELDNFIKETKIEGDTSNYTFIARALLDFGSIKNIRSKGFTSKEVLELYLRMQREQAEAHGYRGINRHHPATINKDIDAEHGGGEEFEEGSVGSSQYTYGVGGEDEHDGEYDEEDEDETYKFATKAGGPLDVLGGFPRPSSSNSNRRRRKSSSVGGTNGGLIASLPEIDTMILLDREVDMVSPLCTPLTYESLLDESFGGLKSGFLNIKSSVLRLDQQENDQDVDHISTDGVIQLSFQSDTLFQEIRDVSVTAVMRILNEKAKELKETQDRMHRTRDVQDLQEFVQRLPELQQTKKRLTTHIALAQRVSAIAGDRKFRATWHAERAAINGDGRPLLERAQDCAARGDSLLKVLRLLCLNCILTGGFSSQKLDEVRQDLIHAYGFDIMFSLDNLERLGLLAQRPFHPQHRLSAPQPTPDQTITACIFQNWALVKKAFRLVVEDDDQGGLVPKDCSYVFAGFAPLSCRLIEMDFAPGGWAARMDTLRSLGDSPTICEVKFTPSSSSASEMPGNKGAPVTTSTTVSFMKPGTAKKRVMLVCFLGGVSYAEIAGLRFISAQPDCPFRIIIATTSVINGSSLMKACCHSGSSDVATTSDSDAANPFA
jgi:hypothetical protein